jgi:hypothetical protein
MAMSRSLGVLTIDLIAKVGGWTAGLDKAERDVKRRTGGIKSAIGGLQKVVAGIGLAYGFKKIIDATAEAEKAFALLDNAVEASGAAAGFSALQLADYAGELQKVSTYDDEAIAGAEQLLLRFQSIQGTNFTDATKAVLDLATALNMDLQSAAQLVGKALENPVKGMNQLARSGVVLGDSQKDLIKRLTETGRQAEAQEILLSELEKRYGGAAAAARNTFGGALAGLKNSFDDLLEGDGGGLEGITASLNDLTDLMNSEEVKKGFQAITSGVLGVVGIVARGATAFADFGKWIGEAFAAQMHGPNPDDLVRYGDAVEDLRQQIVEFQNESAVRKWLENRADPESLGLPAGTKDNHAAVLANMQARLRDMEAKYRKAQAEAAAASANASAAPAPGKPGGQTVTTVASEEFTKLETKLKEQIALYGKTGEAAKIAYDIASGALDELSPKEQQRALSLAREFDGMVKASEAAKVQEQAAKDQAEAQKQLQESYDAQESGLRRQIELSNDATELEKLRYDLANGALEGISPAQRKRLEDLAEERDLLIQRVEVEERVRAVVEETLTPLETYQRTIETLNELYRESNELLGAGGLSYEAYARAVEKAQNELDDALYQSSESFLEGANRALNGYLESVSKTAMHTESVVGNLINGAEDLWTNFTLTGKLKFKDFMRSVIADLARLNTQKLFVSLLSMFSPTAAGAGGARIGGATAPILNAMGNVYSSPSLSAYSGRVMHTPTKFTFAKGAGIFAEAGPEAIMPLERMSSGHLGVRAVGAGSGELKVEIHNYAGGVSHKVEQVSRDEVRIICRDEVERRAPTVIATHLENPNSRVSKSLSRNTTAGRQRT